MAEMSRENAREINEYMYDIENAVKRLLEYKERGESVYVNFNGHKLYSCDVTIDSAYLEVVGMTKEQDDAIRREYDLAKTPEEKEAIMEKWSKLSHQRDQENKPLTDREVEEQEISDMSVEKEQLTAEISDIEQQLQALKAKEAELKKALGDKQSQLNGLEEK